MNATELAAEILARKAELVAELDARPYALPHGHYDRDGNEITYGQWAALFEAREYQQIARDDLGPYWVSTVWLGLDHGFGHSDVPVIFETMVFEQEPSFRKPSEWFPDGFAYHRDYEQRRYRSEEEALEGHAAICNEIRLLMSATGDPR